MTANNTVFWQDHTSLSPYPRGFHLIQSSIEQALKNMPHIERGLLHLFIKHTSASLCLSEHTCASVRRDLETWFNQNIPDDSDRYEHNFEGNDDMPAHIKNTLLGASLSIPIQNDRLALGQWQGIFLCEHRNQAHARTLILTAIGQAG